VAKRPAFIRRVPSFRWHPPQHERLVKREIPAFEADVALLEREFVPRFRALDEGSLRAQNAFRLGQLTLIFGGAAATCLGAVHAALGGGVLALGVVEAVVTGVLAGMVEYARRRNLQRKYFTNRLKAERLRAEYFLFLGRIGSYAAPDEDERRRRLRRRLNEIESAEDE
jgi:hypothetical protein